jgi:hypothetical protein
MPDTRLHKFYSFSNNFTKGIERGRTIAQCIKVKHSAMKTCVLTYVSLTSALAGGEWSASLPGRFTPRERAPDTQWIGGWVGPRVGQDDVEKKKFLTLPGLELRPLCRADRSQSLHRLRYPGLLRDVHIS